MVKFKAAAFSHKDSNALIYLVRLLSLSCFEFMFTTKGVFKPPDKGVAKHYLSVSQFDYEK